MTMLSREAAPVFNAVLGGLAAAAAAFFIFAMPDGLFTSLVGATGIGAFIPAAQPPFGFTARAAAMVLAAGAIFFAVWSLLRRLDARHDPESAPVETEPSALLPRLRRADAHPDAPARRPLLARHELGEPQGPSDEDLEAEPSETHEALPAGGIPDFLAAGTDQADDAAFTRDWEAAPEALGDEDLGPDDISDAGEPPIAAEWDRPAPAEPENAAEPDSTARPAEDPEDREALMARLPLPEDSGDSISVLFRRLDAGLANCEWPLRPSEPAQEQAPQEPEERQDAVGDQLRDALDDLRKMAGGAS